jgi:hypothetical protein
MIMLGHGVAGRGLAAEDARCAASSLRFGSFRMRRYSVHDVQQR